MQLRTKIYIALGITALAVVVVITRTLWSNHQITKQEIAVSEAKSRADNAQRQAIQKETEAAEYGQKIDYLESALARQRQQTRIQDEDIKKHNDNSNNARRRVADARSTRPIDTTTAELCRELAEAGYSCQR